MIIKYGGSDGNKIYNKFVYIRSLVHVMCFSKEKQSIFYWNIQRHWYGPKESYNVTQIRVSMSDR